MMKVLKTFILSIVFFGIIGCDGNNWMREEEPELSTQSLSTESSTPVEELQSSETSVQTENQTIISSETTESITTSTEKPLPKIFGCTTRLWTGGQKFCWTHCDNSSTSSFWNTWCFTTNSTVDDEQATMVECESDEICQPEWICKSSCGMFSPHWDRDSTKLNETIPTIHSNNI